MEIHIDSGSLDRTSFGLVTGIIFFQDENYFFPDRDWNDSILFVLNSLLINLTQKQTYFEVLYMEVSCEVHINVNYENNLIFFSCLEREKEVEHQSSVNLLSFIKNLSTETNRMIRESKILSDEERQKYTNYISQLKGTLKDS